MFPPWSTPAQLHDYWEQLKSTHIPIIVMHEDDLGRDIYVPNPGVGYWVLGNTSEQNLWKVHRLQVEKGYELVSAYVYNDQKGNPVYWALWAAKDKSYLLKEKMKELGITPASVVQGPPLLLRTNAELLAKDATIKGDISYEKKGANIGGWFGDGSSLTWKLPKMKQGTHNVSILYSLRQSASPQRQFEISTNSDAKKITFLPSTHGWNEYKDKMLLPIQISESDTTFTITATKIPAEKCLMNLQKVSLEMARQ